MRQAAPQGRDCSQQNSKNKGQSLFSIMKGVKSRQPTQFYLCQTDKGFNHKLYHNKNGKGIWTKLYNDNKLLKENF